MLVLLDENLPHSLRVLLGDHDVRTVDFQGWKSLSNGELLKAAEEARFDVMITADQGIRYQQNLEGCNIAIIILSSNERETVAAHAAKILVAIETAQRGSFLTLDIGS